MWSTCECDKRLEIIKVGSGSFEPECSHIRPRLEQNKTFKIHDYRVCMIRDETKHCRTVAFQNVPGSVLQAIWNSCPFLFSFSLKLMLMVSYKTHVVESGTSNIKVMGSVPRECMNIVGKVISNYGTRFKKQFVICFVRLLKFSNLI